MKTKRFISILLAVLFVMSALCLPVLAADDPVDIVDYPTTAYTEQKAKVDTMELMYTSDEYGYKMYFDRLSGEFALLNTKTGEYTFSNPYDIGVDSKASGDMLRYALLSQVLVQYTDTTTNNTVFLSSYYSAAVNGDQITFEPMSDGVRVEYAIGTVEAKRLIPKWIEATRFETLILNVLKTKTDLMTEDELFWYNNMTRAFYQKIDQTNPENEVRVDGWRNQYKCLNNNTEIIIYVINVDNARNFKQIETLIRKFCPEYTYDELEYDHELTGYEGEDKEPVLFRLAIEYSIDKYGLSATVPAKSIRYNETNYRLESIVLLPYFGCTSVKNVGTIERTGGYIFIPDGSGTLLSYYNKDGTVKTGTQGTGLMYGYDYTKESLSSGNANIQTARIPVFGLVETYNKTVETSRINRPAKIEVTEQKRGFIGIITEGVSFASITANLQDLAWAGFSGSAEYNTVFTTFNINQSDTVNIGGSLGSGALTTSSDSKYMGNYTVRFILLADETHREALDDMYFECSHVGMADAYRDYLIDDGTLSKFTSEDIADSIPLYIESFGSLEIDSTFLTIPVKKKIALTTFEDLITMSKMLGESNISNLKLILTSFANGTLGNSTYPVSLKWNGVLGGTSGFRKLVKYAQEAGISVFPDFDFANVTKFKPLSGFSMNKHAALTMSGKYSTKRNYDPVLQQVEKFGRSNIVSSAAFLELFNKFNKTYSKMGNDAISLKTLGTDLNSDFNTDNILTREDSIAYTDSTLQNIVENYNKLLISSGNSYALKYATDIVNLALDNSGFSISSYSVPFVGMVLHGTKNYTGSGLNMAGDVKYDVMKALENGAALYFILSYENVEKLKEDFNLTSYYSVNFETWFSDVVKYYTMLNDAMSDLQDATITGHSFLTAYRTDIDTAGVLFGTKIASDNTLVSTKNTYFENISAVDKLIADQRNADEAIVKETASQTLYNAAKVRASYIKKFITRYSEDEVVSVTYTKPDGTSRTFFINYNSYNVAVESDGKVFIVEANSFIDISKVTDAENAVTQSKQLSAWAPTTGALANFNTSYEKLNAAIAEGNELLIERSKTAIDTILSGIADKPADVIEATTNDGKTMYVNLTNKQVIVRITDTNYITIDAQSYLVND